MENHDIKVRQDRLVDLLNDAIYKLQVASKNERSFLLSKSDYEMCLGNLVRRIDTVRNDEFMLKVLKYPPRKRGGFGLSRGFGEVLGNIREPWVEELMDSIYTIERYYRNM